MKYQAQIKHVNGNIITVIQDTDLARFWEEVELAKKDIVAYLGDCDFKNDELVIELVL